MTPKPNFDERQVSPRPLADPLVDSGGGAIRNAADWATRRRDEVFELFSSHIYGRTPTSGTGFDIDLTEGPTEALGGRAIRQQLSFRFGSTGPTIDVLIYAPADAQGSVPAFVGLNFFGNHTVSLEPEVELGGTHLHLADAGISVDDASYRLALVVTEPAAEIGDHQHLASNSPTSGGEQLWVGDLQVGRIFAEAPAVVSDRPAGIALVDREHVVPGTPVEVESLDRRLGARIVPIDQDVLRGAMSNSWPVQLLVERGYALVTAWYFDFAPDLDGYHRSGVHRIFGPAEGRADSFPDEEWGAIGAWGWGLSRLLDLCEELSAIDANRVAVVGHSRLGKAALWAAASDERFSMAVSNNSGCLGASLSSRNFGETINALTDRYPHWACPGLARRADDRQKLIVDQHELLALIAPRPLYVASAADDLWADPLGEYLSAREAGRVYELFGYDVSYFAADQLPTPGTASDGVIGHHVRTGSHAATVEDWWRYLDHADRWL